MSKKKKKGTIINKQKQQKTQNTHGTAKSIEKSKNTYQKWGQQ